MCATDMRFRLGVSCSDSPTDYGFFLFRDPPTTELYTLSLHDALPISDHFAPALCLRMIVHLPASTCSSYSKARDRKSTRLNSSHANISYAVFCLKKKKTLIAASRDP